MPTYEYGCIACDHKFDIIKRIANIDDPETCPKCQGKDVRRYISRTHFYGASDWDRAEYNPGLGIVTRNAKHRAREARARGLIEVGNEDFEKTCNHYDKQIEKEADARFEEAFKPTEVALKEELRKSR